MTEFVVTYPSMEEVKEEDDDGSFDIPVTIQCYFNGFEVDGNICKVDSRAKQIGIRYSGTGIFGWVQCSDIIKICVRAELVDNLATALSYSVPKSQMHEMIYVRNS